MDGCILRCELHSWLLLQIKRELSVVRCAPLAHSGSVRSFVVARRGWGERVSRGVASSGGIEIQPPGLQLKNRFRLHVPAFTQPKLLQATLLQSYVLGKFCWLCW